MELGIIVWSLGGFVGIGVLWFYVARPMLEDFGLLRPRESVNDFAEDAPEIMSRDGALPVDVSPVVPTDGRASDAGRTEPQPAYTTEQLLTHYQWLRRLGAKRDEARPHLKAMGIPLHNDLWARAAPPPQAVTPIAGRPYDPARYHYEDPDLRYQALDE